MKKSIVMMAFAIATLNVVSCGKNTETEATSETNEVSKEIAKAEYICPMDCEKGKTYDAAGKCATCEMDLVVKKHEKGEKHEEGANHEGHDHDKE